LDASTLHLDDSWPLLGWKAHRWIDVQRTGSTSLGFVWVLRAWLDAFGFSYRHARWVPLVASVLAAPAFFVVALRMRLRYPAAVLGAAMLLASPILVSYATRVKQYSLEVPLAILVIGLAAALLRDPTSTRMWVFFTIVAVDALIVSFALIGVVVAGFVVADLAFLRGRGAMRRVRSPAVICTLCAAAFVGVWYLVVVRPAQSPLLQHNWSGFYLSQTPAPPSWWHGRTVRPGLLDHDWTLVQTFFRNAFTGPAIALVCAFLVATVLVALRRPLYGLLFGLPVVIAVVASVARFAPFGGGRTDTWIYAPVTFMIATGVDIVLEFVHNAGRRSDDRARIRSRRLRPRDLAFGGGVVVLALVCMFNIPAASTFAGESYDVVPLVRQMEASRSARDLVVVSLPLTFNYALAAPQPFTTKVSDRYATHFTPTVHGVNAINWVDYARPVAELRARLRRTNDVWLLDTPEIFNALGPAPRKELAAQGFARMTRSRSGFVVLEHWRRPSS
jgi:hypothetical protein